MPWWGLASPGAPIMTGLPDMDKIGGGRGGSTMLNGTGLMSGRAAGKRPIAVLRAPN